MLAQIDQGKHTHSALAGTHARRRHATAKGVREICLWRVL